MLKIAEDYRIKDGRVIKPGDMYEDGTKPKKVRLKADKQSDSNAGEKSSETDLSQGKSRGENNPSVE